MEPGRGWAGTGRVGGAVWTNKGCCCGQCPRALDLFTWVQCLGLPCGVARKRQGCPAFAPQAGAVDRRATSGRGRQPCDPHGEWPLSTPHLALVPPSISTLRAISSRSSRSTALEGSAPLSCRMNEPETQRGAECQAAPAFEAPALSARLALQHKGHKQQRGQPERRRA